MRLPSQLVDCLEQLDTDQRRMPATILYNEGWMLRLLLHAGERGLLPGYLVEKGQMWFSEAQLRTPFGRRLGRGSESNTRPDGVVGDFHPIRTTRSGLDLRDDADTFVVFEAKMFASLGSRTRNAPGYDQAARTVACMAHTLQRAGRDPRKLNRVGFFLLAPKVRIGSGVFDLPLTEGSIRARIDERISPFTDHAKTALEEWRDKWASPLIDRLAEAKNLRCVSWEDLIDEVKSQDAEVGESLDSFYQQCLDANRPSTSSPRVAGLPQRGMEYTIRTSNQPTQKVRVCKVGKLNSRVCLSDPGKACFKVPNADLVEVPPEEQSPPPPDPIKDSTYLWDRPDGALIRVKVLNVGPCKSRVVDENSREDLVPIHQLRSCDQTPPEADHP